MRTIMLAILALVVATSLSAQKFEIGLNGGVGFNTVPGIEGAYDPQGKKQSPASPAASLKLTYTHKNWRYGIEAGWEKIPFKLPNNAAYYLIDSQLVIVHKGEINCSLADPAIPLQAIIERTASYKKLKLYAGASVGYVFVSHAKLPMEFVTIGRPQFISPPGYGLTAGLHAGASYYITKRIGINAEVSGNYMHLNLEGPIYNLYEFPFTAGICYTL